VPTIGTTESRACAKTSLGEIQSVANQTPNAIELCPPDVRLIDAALINQVLNQSPYRIIGQRRDYRGIQTKASLQTTRDVVLAAAFPNLKAARRRYPAVTGIKTQHYFTETHQVPAALAFRSDLQRVRACHVD
jgi:hypothetical protein